MNVLDTRTYELKLHGGTSFESGAEVDPAISLSGTAGVQQQYIVDNNLLVDNPVITDVLPAASGSCLPPIL